MLKSSITSENVIIGKTYKTRRFPHAGFSDLHDIKVVDKYTLGDGTKIISYVHKGFFPMIRQMEEYDFIKNTAF